MTKSLVGLLYGIALADGKVPPPAAVLVDQFPEYPDLAADPARRRLTVAHALTMTMGLEWNENLPYTSAANSEIAMERAPDRYRFVLEQPVREAPGSRWGYNGGATALLGRIIARGVGAALPDHAETVLFGPLGIAQFEWIRGQDGAPSAASGLRLTPRNTQDPSGEACRVQAPLREVLGAGAHPRQGDAAVRGVPERRGDRGDGLRTVPRLSGAPRALRAYGGDDGGDPADLLRVGGGLRSPISGADRPDEGGAGADLQAVRAVKPHPLTPSPS